MTETELLMWARGPALLPQAPAQLEGRRQPAGSRVPQAPRHDQLLGAGPGELDQLASAREGSATVGAPAKASGEQLEQRRGVEPPEVLPRRSGGTWTQGCSVRRRPGPGECLRRMSSSCVDPCRYVLLPARSSAAASPGRVGYIDSKGRTWGFVCEVMKWLMFGMIKTELSHTKVKLMS